MVKSHFRWLGTTVISLIPLLPLQAKDLADYQLGDLAETNIATPVALEVIDEEATQTLKDRESRRGTVVFCFYPGWVSEAETALRSSFDDTRSNFLNVIGTAFQKRKLGPQELSATNFLELAAAFQKQNTLFPMDAELAGVWASGDHGENVESNAVAQLRWMMSQPVRSDYVPEGIKVGTKVRLLTVSNEVSPTVDLAALYSVDLHKTNLHSVPRSKMWVQQRFPREQAALGEHVASFVKPNCFIDVDLTRGLQLRTIEGLWAGDRYDAGEVIAKQGEAIDKKKLAALAALQEKLAASHLEQVIADDATKTAQARRQTQLLVAGFSLGLLVSVVIVWKLAKRRAATMLPAHVGADLGAAAGASADDIWRRRALAAEERAAQANKVIREGLISHLGRWMSNSLVQKLLVQRAQLLDTQKKAVTEMDELGERLDTLHSRMQDRLTAYELQIAELERRLEAKDEMNRELIRSEIASIKRQMEAERIKGEMEFTDEWRPGVS